MKKTGRGRPKTAAAKSAAPARVKKAPVKKAAAKKKVAKKTVTKKPAIKKAAIKKTVAKKSMPKKALSKKKAAPVVNTAAERVKALRAELAALKAELKLSQKREAGLAKIAGNMSSAVEKSIAQMMKKEMGTLEKALKPKPARKKKAKAVKAAAPAAVVAEQAKAE